MITCLPLNCLSSLPPLCHLHRFTKKPGEREREKERTIFFVKCSVSVTGFTAETFIIILIKAKRVIFTAPEHFPCPRKISSTPPPVFATLNTSGLSVRLGTSGAFAAAWWWMKVFSAGVPGCHHVEANQADCLVRRGVEARIIAKGKRQWTLKNVQFTCLWWFCILGLCACFFPCQTSRQRRRHECLIKSSPRLECPQSGGATAGSSLTSLLCSFCSGFKRRRATC